MPPFKSRIALFTAVGSPQTRSRRSTHFPVLPLQRSSLLRQRVGRAAPMDGNWTTQRRTRLSDRSRACTTRTWRRAAESTRAGNWRRTAQGGWGETWAGAGSVGVRGGEGAGGRDGKRDERARATNGVEGSPSSFCAHVPSSPHLSGSAWGSGLVSSVEQDLPDDPLRAKYIQGTLVPDALSYLSRLLSVRVLPPDPLLLPVTCAAFTALSNGTSACTQLAPMCDVSAAHAEVDIDVDPSLLAAHSLCQSEDPATCGEVAAGTGTPGADIILFLSAKLPSSPPAFTLPINAPPSLPVPSFSAEQQTATCSSTTAAAHASHCAVDPASNRPLAASLNLCPLAWRAVGQHSPSYDSQVAPGGEECAGCSARGWQGEQAHSRPACPHFYPPFSSPPPLPPFPFPPTSSHRIVPLISTFPRSPSLSLPLSPLGARGAAPAHARTRLQLRALPALQGRKRYAAPHAPPLRCCPPSALSPPLVSSAPQSRFRALCFLPLSLPPSARPPGQPYAQVVATARQADGSNVSKIVTPAVVAAAQRHFDCPALDGAELHSAPPSVSAPASSPASAPPAEANSTEWGSLVASAQPEEALTGGVALDGVGGARAGRWRLCALLGSSPSHPLTCLAATHHPSPSHPLTCLAATHHPSPSHPLTCLAATHHPSPSHPLTCLAATHHPSPSHPLTCLAATHHPSPSHPLTCLAATHHPSPSHPLTCLAATHHPSPSHPLTCLAATHHPSPSHPLTCLAATHHPSPSHPLTCLAATHHPSPSHPLTCLAATHHPSPSHPLTCLAATHHPSPSHPPHMPCRHSSPLSLPSPHMPCRHSSPLSLPSPHMPCRHSSPLSLPSPHMPCRHSSPLSLPSPHMPCRHSSPLSPPIPSHALPLLITPLPPPPELPIPPPDAPTGRGAGGIRADASALPGQRVPLTCSSDFLSVATLWSRQRCQAPRGAEESRSAEVQALGMAYGPVAALPSCTVPQFFDYAFGAGATPPPGAGCYPMRCVPLRPPPPWTPAPLNPLMTPHCSRPGSLGWPPTATAVLALAHKAQGGSALSLPAPSSTPKRQLRGKGKGKGKRGGAGEEGGRDGGGGICYNTTCHCLPGYAAADCSQVACSPLAPHTRLHLPRACLLRPRLGVVVLGGANISAIREGARLQEFQAQFQAQMSAAARATGYEGQVEVAIDAIYAGSILVHSTVNFFQATSFNMPRRAAAATSCAVLLPSRHLSPRIHMGCSLCCPPLSAVSLTSPAMIFAASSYFLALPSGRISSFNCSMAAAPASNSAPQGRRGAAPGHLHQEGDARRYSTHSKCRITLTAFLFLPALTAQPAPFHPPPRLPLIPSCLCVFPSTCPNHPSPCASSGYDATGAPWYMEGEEYEDDMEADLDLDLDPLEAYAQLVAEAQQHQGGDMGGIGRHGGHGRDGGGGHAGGHGAAVIPALIAACSSLHGCSSRGRRSTPSRPIPPPSCPPPSRAISGPILFHAPTTNSTFGSGAAIPRPPSGPLLPPSAAAREAARLGDGGKGDDDAEGQDGCEGKGAGGAVEEGEEAWARAALRRLVRSGVGGRWRSSGRPTRDPSRPPRPTTPTPTTRTASPAACAWAAHPGGCLGGCPGGLWQGGQRAGRGWSGELRRSGELAEGAGARAGGRRFPSGELGVGDGRRGKAEGDVRANRCHGAACRGRVHGRSYAGSYGGSYGGSHGGSHGGSNAGSQPGTQPQSPSNRAGAGRRAGGEQEAEGSAAVGSLSGIEPSLLHQMHLHGMHLPHHLPIHASASQPSMAAHGHPSPQPGAQGAAAARGEGGAARMVRVGSADSAAAAAAAAAGGPGGLARASSGGLPGTGGSTPTLRRGLSVSPSHRAALVAAPRCCCRSAHCLTVNADPQYPVEDSGADYAPTPSMLRSRSIRVGRSGHLTASGQLNPSGQLRASGQLRTSGQLRRLASGQLQVPDHLNLNSTTTAYPTGNTNGGTNASGSGAWSYSAMGPPAHAAPSGSTDTTAAAGAGEASIMCACPGSWCRGNTGIMGRQGNRPPVLLPHKPAVCQASHTSSQCSQASQCSRQGGRCPGLCASPTRWLPPTTPPPPGSLTCPSAAPTNGLRRARSNVGLSGQVEMSGRVAQSAQMVRVPSNGEYSAAQVTPSGQLRRNSPSFATSGQLRNPSGPFAQWGRGGSGRREELAEAAEMAAEQAEMADFYTRMRNKATSGPIYFG
ncbi:unnamed protein product [Closterium sp. NIES-64]|nr:unnamed protein product [Closterium sp. NIES-64]